MLTKILPLVALLLTQACGNLKQFGLQTRKAEDLSLKYGIKSLTVDETGNYVLQWDVPEALIDQGVDGDGNYEVYMSQVTAAPSAFVELPELTNSDGTNGRNIGGVKIGNLSDDESPAGKRAILTTVKGARAHTLKTAMNPPGVYLFQVRYVTTGAAADLNTRVLMYEPSKNKATFQGITGLSKSPSGKLTVSWAPLADSTASSPKGTTYQVYAKSSYDSIDGIVSKGTKITSSLALADAAGAQIGVLVEFPEKSEYLSGGSLLGEVRDTPKYEISEPLTAGLTYVLRVQAKNALGSLGLSNRAIVFRQNALVFTGLKNENVTVRPDLSGIDLSWDAATGTSAPVSYQVYGQGNAVGQTTSTSYRYSDIIPGDTYTFFVTATDGESTLGASNVVSVKVPNATSYQGCSTAQSRGTTSVEVSFLKPIGAKQIAVYRNNSQIALKDYANRKLTYVDALIDTGLAPNTSYTYTCRVFYEGFTILGTNSLQATTAPTLTFEGLKQSGVSLAADASSIALSWTAASYGQGAVTYYIYDDAPTFAAARVIATTSNTSYTLANPTRNRTYTLGVRARDNGGYDSNTSFAVILVPRQTGLASGVDPEIVEESTWSDGTAKIKLTLSTLGPTGTYRIFLSNSSDISTFDFDRPWETFVGTPNPSGGVSYIYVGGKGRTFSGANYFVVREGTSGDSNVIVSPVVDIPSSLANFIRVPKTQSKLAYDYYLGAFEASVSGTFNPGIAINDNESDLTTCSYEFHVIGDAFHSSCGAKASSTARAVHRLGVASARATWHQAYVACRNASHNASGLMVRLPTPEEWRRASRWSPTNYAQMWPTYVNDGNEFAKCSTPSTSRDVGADGACRSTFGVYDMAGNLSEWVDARLVRDTRSATPVGRVLANGIDLQASPSTIGSTPRLHGIVPDSSTPLALLLGSDRYNAMGTPKPYDTESEAWADAAQDPSALDGSGNGMRGFRCVAFPSLKLVPSMAQLALPQPPRYTASSPSIPPGQHIHDAVVETVSHNATPPQSYTLSWVPWSKTVCSGGTNTCTVDSSISYEVYRYVEPTSIDMRPRVPWALTSGTYATIANVGAMPLDPLYSKDDSGVSFCSATSTVCKLVKTLSSTECTASSCAFTDTSSETGFNWSALYRYVVVAKDAQGNAVTPEVQRSLPPSLAGDLNPSATRYFRREIRWRRAGGFLLGSGSQTMVFVPMQESGLDHDYFLQKYPANVVLAPADSDNYPSDPAKCLEMLWRTGGVDGASCGRGDLPSVSLGSQQGTAALELTQQGTALFSCLATKVAGLYPLRLPSDLEWVKATGLGDLGSYEWTASRVKADGSGLNNGLDGLWPTLTLSNSSGSATGVVGTLSNSSPSLESYTSGAALVRCAL